MALLGPSGCGKSTTLAIVAGITQEDSGVVLIGGQEMRGLPAHRRGIGVVFQSYALFPHMTVQRNIEFGPKVQHLDSAEMKRRVDQALAMTHLTAFRDRLPKQLSGGQQQRAAIARALASGPRLLLLDEPLSSLDASLREEMQAEIRDLQQQTGISMIFVTHDQQEAMAIGDQVGVILEGTMRQTGTPEELYSRPQDVNVARMLGKINTMPATVAGLHDSTVSLTGLGGERWQGLLPSGQSAVPGCSALVLVRPESLRISPRENGMAAVGENSVNGIVKRTMFLGREMDVLVELGFGTLEVRCAVTVGTDLRVGQDVSVGWQTAQATVYSGGSELQGAACSAPLTVADGSRE
jgi:ABC-type Fe3+/spermidine/putrescine transport system ATPase subunit